MAHLAVFCDPSSVLVGDRYVFVTNYREKFFEIDCGGNGNKLFAWRNYEDVMQGMAFALQGLSSNELKFANVSLFSNNRNLLHGPAQSQQRRVHR